MSRSGVSTKGFSGTRTILRSTAFALASATTFCSPLTSDATGALTPPSRTSAMTSCMHASTGVVAGSRPTVSQTWVGMNMGRPGVVTCQTVLEHLQQDWQHARMRTRLDRNLMISSTSVLLGSGAPPTQPVAATDESGVDVSSVNSFSARDDLQVGDQSYEIYRLDAVPGTENLPYSLKVLAENLLRTEDGTNITKEHIEAIANWDPSADPSVEIQFTPARVIMQDFTGVPCIVDLATMREAVGDLGS